MYQEECVGLDPFIAHEYGKETLSLEFKSDLKRLPDDDLLDAVVALANSDGGTVYLGVEDDGTPTGIDKVHQDAVGLSAMIANRTVPPVSARAQIVGTEKTPVMQIDVPKSRSVVSTKSGKVLRRRMKVDGTPESVPMYPYEIATRLSDLGRLDFSAQPVPDATRDDFDPLERDRLRRIIGTYQSSDRNLLELTDEELEKSLQADVMELLHVDANQAYYQLSKLVKGGKLRVIGRGKGARYTIGGFTGRK